MRVLFLDQFNDLGGAQLCLLDLLPELVQRGWEPHVALPAGGALADRVLRLGVPTHRLPQSGYSLGEKTVIDGLRFLAGLAAAALRIRGLVNTTGAELVYINGPRLVAAMAASRARVPVVFHSHNRIAGAGSRRLARAALAALGAHVIAASRYVAKQWKKAEVVYGGVEGPDGATPVRSGGSRIGMIGRIAPQKRQLEFVIAAAELAQSRPEVEFVLCGDALFNDRRSRDYQEEVLSAAPASLRWLGWRDSVYEVLGGLDLLVVPSADEGGVPRVVLEAFSCGVPVLARASGATLEAVEEGVTGFLLNSSHPSEIARRIREVLAAPERRAAVAARAQRLWAERFTAVRFRNAIAGVIQRLTAPARASSAGTSNSR